MIYLRSIGIPVGIYVIYILISRYLSASNTALDWSFFWVCALLPIVDSKIRTKMVLAIGLPLLNAVIMFFITFWVIAIVFKEGL